MELVIIIGITIIGILLIASVIGIVWWRQNADVEEDVNEEEEKEVSTTVPITVPVPAITTVAASVPALATKTATTVPATKTAVFKINNQQIKSRIGDNQCLEVSFGKGNNKAMLGTFNCSNKDHQKFKLDDKQRLVIKHSDKCVAIGENNQIFQWKCSDVDSQKWDYDDGQLRSIAKKDQCLSANKAKVSLYKCNKSKNQQWFL